MAFFYRSRSSKAAINLDQLIEEEHILHKFASDSIMVCCTNEKRRLGSLIKNDFYDNKCICFKEQVANQEKIQKHPTLFIRGERIAEGIWLNPDLSLKHHPSQNRVYPPIAHDQNDKSKMRSC